MKKYKIKEECKKYVDPDIRDLEYTLNTFNNSFSYLGENSLIPISSGFTCEMFEEAKDRIAIIEIRGSVSKVDNSEFTNQEMIIMDKALNGELVDRDDMIKKAHDWEEYMKETDICTFEFFLNNRTSFKSSHTLYTKEQVIELHADFIKENCIDTNSREWINRWVTAFKKFINSK